MELWQAMAARAKRRLDEQQVAQLGRYVDLLLEANQRMNLTRLVDRSAAEQGHIGDALTLLEHLPEGAFSLVDVGTGGGVPGIPLAIACPGARVTLVESVGKKARVLQEMVQTLGLAQVTVLDQRAETVGQSSLRETFDVAVARAVGELVWIAEWCLPLVKKGGCVLAMKGPRITEELPAARKAIRLLGGGAPKVQPSGVSEESGHVIVTIPKTGRSDLRYPRSPTTAKGKPIA